MKFRATQKEIKANFSKIISVPYCGLQNLLNFESPVAFTARREGWAADIFDMGSGVAIVTGYAPFGNIRRRMNCGSDTKSKRNQYAIIIRFHGRNSGSSSGSLQKSLLRRQRTNRNLGRLHNYKV